MLCVAERKYNLIAAAESSGKGANYNEIFNARKGGTCLGEPAVRIVTRE